MVTTKIKKGYLVTSTTTEQDLELEGPYEPTGVQTLTIEHISGSVQYGVGKAGGSPILNSSWATISTANQKIVLTVETGRFNLRCVGSGTFIVNW